MQSNQVEASTAVASKQNQSSVRQQDTLLAIPDTKKGGSIPVSDQSNINSPVIKSPKKSKNGMVIEEFEDERLEEDVDMF